MSRLKTISVGSAAGGGYPQWNCLGATSALFWAAGSTEMRQQAFRAPAGNFDVSLPRFPAKTVSLASDSVYGTFGPPSPGEGRALRFRAVADRGGSDAAPAVRGIRREVSAGRHDVMEMSL